MTVSELNKQRVRQFFEEVLSEGRLELIDELVANDFLGRIGGVLAALNGQDAVRRFVSRQRVSCPDLYIKIEEQFAEGDRVVTRWRATARAPHLLVPPATGGLSPCCAGITIVRLLAGKQVDAHTHCAGPGASLLRLAG
jgi:hypothetical protein